MDLNSSKACNVLKAKLEKLSPEESECTIYRVHRHLRNVNPNAYEPEVIAIGPYHRGKDHLKMMEDYKLRNLKMLIERKGSGIITYAAAVERVESKARQCYADQDFNLSATEFIEMLVLDGCFIVELVRKFQSDFNDENDYSIFQLRWMISSLQRDLMLFENQVPFFVLCELFDLIVGPDQYRELLQFLLNFFSSLIYPSNGQLGLEEVVKECAHNEIKHLLEFVHRIWLPPLCSHESGSSKEKKETGDRDLFRRFLNRIQAQGSKQKSKRGGKKEAEKEQTVLKYCATGLKGANVKFKRKAKDSLFDVEFKDGVLTMAPLVIDDGTECFLRNLIAYEQYFRHCPRNFATDYIILLDSLINSGKDVELLSRNHIIVNMLGDDEVVASMVNRLGDWVTYCDDCFIYNNVFQDVNKHCRKPWNSWMAKLRRNYLHSPWAIISILAAVVLLLLTITQTVFTILQVVRPE